MLVLKRKEGEVIVINDNIRITVVGIEGSAVKLGVEAPKDVKVFREEVLKKIEERMRSSILSQNIENKPKPVKLKKDKQTL